MKEWEKWKAVKDLFLNPERRAMKKLRCPKRGCALPPIEVQIRAERPPYLWRCKKLHVWRITDGKAVLYSEKP